ncbi:MAG: hypothetical protein ACI81R_002101 [Bradymonadia bacterium]|jgi:hypothetical protein
MRTLSLIVVFLVASCSRGDAPATDPTPAEATSSGISTPVDPPPAELPEESSLTWVFEASSPHAVIEEGGVVYLQIENVALLEHEHLDRSLIPAAWFDGDSSRGATLPYTGLGIATPEIAVISTEGRCVPRLGDPVWVNRSGCTPNGALAVPLSGCSGRIAPFAWAPHAVPASTTWVPSPDSAPEAWDVLADTSSPVADWAAGWRERFSARAELVGLPVSGRVEFFVVPAGAESLDVQYGAAQSSQAPGSECDFFCEHFERAIVQPAGVELPVRGPVLGVFATNGRIAAVVLGTDNFRQLFARNDDGTLRKHFDVMHRTDSDACVASLFPLVCEPPCSY